MGNINLDPNQQEQAMLELVKNNKHIKLFDLDSNDEISQPTMMLLEIGYEDSQGGQSAGNELFQQLHKKMPDCNSFLLGFSGYAHKPNTALFQEIDILYFIHGFLFGDSPDGPNTLQAKHALNLMFHEPDLISKNTDMKTLQQIYELAGDMWVAAHAFPKQLFVQDKNSPTGFSRDIGTNEKMLDILKSHRKDTEIDEMIKQLIGSYY
jgi:hypothetical protein